MRGDAASNTIAIFALVLAFASAAFTAVFSYTTNRTQEQEAKLNELHALYPRISMLLSTPNRSEPQDDELDAEIGVADSLVAELHDHVASGDLLFIAEAYKARAFLSQAAPFYARAAQRAKTPNERLLGYRGSAYVAALLGKVPIAEESMRRAVAAAAGERDAVDRLTDNVTNQRLWVEVEGAMGRCPLVRRHARSFFAFRARLPPEINESQSDVAIVRSHLAACS